MITSYKILMANGELDLIQEVNESIKEGYVPQGGPYKHNSGVIVCQAMIK